MTQNKAKIGFDQMGSHGNGIKVFDYCAGTGLFSRALAPHVSKILGMDSAENMVIEYNKHAEETKEAHPECEMRAIVGDLVYGRVPVAEIPDDFLPFDLLAMCVSLVSICTSGTILSNRPKSLPSTSSPQVTPPTTMPPVYSAPLHPSHPASNTTALYSSSTSKKTTPGLAPAKRTRMRTTRQRPTDRAMARKSWAMAVSRSERRLRLWAWRI